MDYLEIYQMIAPGITTCVSIISTIIAAVFIRKKTKIQEFEKLKVGLLEEVLDDLLESGEMTYTELFKTRNVIKIARLADKYMNNRNKVVREKYDFDLFFRFYNEAGNVSIDFLQKYWAKLLANEVSQKYSYSYKIIDVLKNMNQSDALLFEKVCHHAINTDYRVFIPNYEEYLKNNNIIHDDIIRLSEYGLIHLETNINLTFNTNEKEDYFYNNNHVMVLPQDKSMIITLEEFQFTTVGTDLANIVGKFGNNDDLIWLAKTIKDNYGIIPRLYPLKCGDDNSIVYDMENELSF